MALIEKSPFERFLDGLIGRLKSVPRATLKPVIQPFVHPARDIVWRQDGHEPGVWIEIVRRPDGLFSFTQWKRKQLSTPSIGPWEADIPVFESGLYGSQDEARQGVADYLAVHQT